ncbi:Fur family transcriptional regulator [Erythrobacter sp. W302b]|uniref:Fur family transcriptional regulator n=1 Tax=Erythrobacter sp. W302b TaxID=3389874 RepID=UPI00396B2116
MNELMKSFEGLCESGGLRMTAQRRIIVRCLSESSDHPTIEELHARAQSADQSISVATVYRTMNVLEEVGLIERHDFGGSKARFEPAPDAHHDHLIDVTSGQVIEFVDPEIEQLQRAIAARLGYRLVDHKLELFGVPLKVDQSGSQ